MRCACRLSHALGLALLATFFHGDRTEAQTPPKHLIVVTHTTSFRHSSIPVAEATLELLGHQSGLYDVTFCRNAQDVRRMLVPDFLRSYDGVFFANTTGNLGIPDLAAFLEWIASGKAFLGAHSAADTYHPGDGGVSSDYVDMLGGEFLTHGDQTEVAPRVEDRWHPAGRALLLGYRVFDEIYEFKTNMRGKVNVLLSLDRHPNDGHPQAGEPGDFLLAWHKGYGLGKVFYTALGHREDVWQSEAYRAHLLGAIRWALDVPYTSVGGILDNGLPGVVRRDSRH